MTTEPLRNVPKQKRALERLSALREAAAVVYDRDGRDRFSTASVAELAGCSIGTVYRYFDDKVALLDDIAPDRDNAPQLLERVREVLMRPLPMVTSSREKDRKALMDEAVALIDG